ncbi:MAG: hypothetical protein Q9180_004187 [Flavoplaca navasiana]
MDRGRDRRYYDERPPPDDTYRPSDRAQRSPVRTDSYRGNRSPPRRARTPPQYAVDSYAPGARGGRPRSRSPRRRSRSPATRGRFEGGGYRARPRSPPPRTFSPRRDSYARSPPRARRYSRSPPARARSPPPVRRDAPVDSRRPRSPYRGRPASPPRERYERRGYSLSRDSASRNPPKDDNYRPAPRERSRSPLRRSANISRAPSPMSSHGSARQMHPDRLPGGSRPRSPVYAESRQVAQEALPTYRDRSPPRRPRSPLPARSPPRDYRQRSPPPPRRRESPPPPRDDFRNGSTPAKWSENPMNAPTGPSYRNGDSRPPPSVPAYQDRYAREAPSPSAPPSAPISMSAHNRPSSAAHHQPPIRPRGGGYGSHPRDGPYGPPRGRGGYYSGPPPTRQSYDSRSPADGPPSGPRGAPPPSSSHGPPPSSSYYDHRSAIEPHRPPFRSNNSSSTTYPRTQRFNHPAAASLPQPIPGGKINSAGIDPAAEKRLQELEEQKRKLLDAIDEKQAGKRKVLREWERGEAEVKRDGLRSELAERGLESLTGEGGGVGNAF